MTLNIAHRGGAALWPENTLPAFADAIASGCDGAELDVQLSRDGAVVVHHDFRLMAGVARKDGVWVREPGPRIADLSLAELRAFDVGHPEPGGAYALQYPLLQPVDAAIPTLDEVILLAQGAPRHFDLFVELKCEADADPVTLADAVHAVVAGTNFLSGVIFVSFDRRTLARLRQRGATCWFLHRYAGRRRPAGDRRHRSGGRAGLVSRLSRRHAGQCRLCARKRPQGGGLDRQ